MDLYDKFKLIESYFKSVDDAIRERNKRLHFDTQYGIWGPSSMLDTFELFMKMKLDEMRGLVDLGSGDGRIVLIAALFTNACGIEGEASLSEKAEKAKAELQERIPELARANFVTGDYTKEDLSGYEVLFTFCDHKWDPSFEQKLQRECTGVLLSYNRIFLPERLAKGRTYWMQQIPIVTYWLNREEKELYKNREEK
jgi:hypothetical protein